MQRIGPLLLVRLHPHSLLLLLLTLPPSFPTLVVFRCIWHRLCCQPGVVVLCWVGFLLLLRRHMRSPPSLPILVVCSCSWHLLRCCNR